MIKLRKTIEATKLSNPELSIKLGHSRKYLTNLLNKGCSTAMQNQLIEEINQVVAGTFKTDVEVIAELTQRLSEEQNAVIELQAESDKYFKKYDDCFTQLSQQKEENISLKIEKDSIIAVLGPEIKSLESIIDTIDSANDELRSAIIDKNQEIKKLRQSQKIHRIFAFTCLAVIVLLSVIKWGV